MITPRPRKGDVVAQGHKASEWASPSPSTLAQVTMSCSPSTPAPVAQGLPGLSLTRSICLVWLFCQHRHFLGPLLPLPSGSSPDLPHLWLLLSFLGCDSCTLICPQGLGGRGRICICSGTQCPAQSGLCRKLFVKQTHPWVRLCTRSQDPQSLASRLHLGQVMGGGHTMITKSRATLWGPPCYSLLCSERSRS